MIVLRLAFILPALADFLIAGLTLLRLAGVDDESIVPRLQFASVAFAWGILLLFAMERPIERAWALLPTILAVAGVCSAICFGYYIGVVDGVSALFAALTAVVIFGFMYFGLRFAHHATSQSNSQVAP